MNNLIEIDPNFTFWNIKNEEERRIFFDDLGIRQRGIVIEYSDYLAESLCRCTKDFSYFFNNFIGNRYHRYKESKYRNRILSNPPNFQIIQESRGDSFYDDYVMGRIIHTFLFSREKSVCILSLSLQHADSLFREITERISHIPFFLQSGLVYSRKRFIKNESLNYISISNDPRDFLGKGKNLVVLNFHRDVNYSDISKIKRYDPDLYYSVRFRRGNLILKFSDGMKNYELLNSIYDEYGFDNLRIDWEEVKK